jgi:hypothetical protein
MIAWDEAEKAGINPSEGEYVEQPKGFTVGGPEAAEVRRFIFDFLVEDDRYFIRVPNAPVLIIRPWEHPGIPAILGTRAMEFIRLEISVNRKWVAGTPKAEMPRIQTSER